MGAYINPRNGMTKEQWLKENGFPTWELRPQIKWEDVPKGYLPVCLINNGLFTAAGIAFNERELAVFNDPSDTRPRIWFFCDVDDLYPVSNLDSYLRKGEEK